MKKLGFLSRGRSQAKQSIVKRAEEEIKIIQAGQLTEQEKQAKIQEVQSKRDQELSRVADPRILWGKR